MLKLIKTCAAILLLTGIAYGQNIRYDNVAFSGRVPPNSPYLNSATVTVCTSGGSGLPCIPKASLCSSQTDTSCTAPNPITTDAFGNYGFWLKPGTYIITITAAGFTGYSTTLTLDTLTSPPSTYAVQYVTTTGNDLNNGTAADDAHAKLTLAAALSALPGGRGTVYVGAGTFVTNAVIIIPNKVSIVFTGGRGDAGSGGTVIQAGASFPGGSPVVQFGASAPSFGVQLIGPGTIDCNNKTGIGIQNDNAQEMSYARDIDIANCSGPALDIEGSGAQNSGPFSNLHIVPGSAAVTGTLGVKVYNVPAFRGISSVTVDNTGYTSKPTTSVQIDASGFYRGIHTEASTNGIIIGSQIATNSVHVENFWAASTVTTGIVISNAFSTQDILLTNLNLNGATNLVSDQISSKTLTDGSLSLYLLGNGTTKEVLTSSANTSSLLQAIAMLGGLNMNGNTISDGSTSNGVSVASQGIGFAAKIFSGLGTPPNGTVVYCSDCTIANPCAGLGAGAIAKRLNNAWVCN